MERKSWVYFAPLCAIAMWTLPSAEAQVVTGEPSPALKTCVTSNAAGVEKAISSLDEAVDFLVQKMCAAPLTEQLEAQQAEIQEQMAAAQRKRMAAMCDASATASPEAVVIEPENGYDFWASMCDPDVLEFGLDVTYPGLYGFGFGGGEATSPAATSLAAQLLLKLRIDRMGGTP